MKKQTSTAQPNRLQRALDRSVAFFQNASPAAIRDKLAAITSGHRTSAANRSRPTVFDLVQSKVAAFDVHNAIDDKVSELPPRISAPTVVVRGNSPVGAQPAPAAVSRADAPTTAASSPPRSVREFAGRLAALTDTRERSAFYRRYSKVLGIDATGMSATADDDAPTSISEFTSRLSALQDPAAAGEYYARHCQSFGL